MKRKKARGLVMELARRIYLEEYGDLKGFGIVAKHYRDDYRHTNHYITGGYKNAWNHPIFVDLRKMYDM